MSSSSSMNPKASPRRKDKTQPASKNQRKGELSSAKKDGHGKFNWGKPADYEYVRDPTEGDDKRVLDDLLRDTSIVLVPADYSSTTQSNTTTGPV